MEQTRTNTSTGDMWVILIWNQNEPEYLKDELIEGAKKNIKAMFSNFDVIKLDWKVSEWLRMCSHPHTWSTCVEAHFEVYPKDNAYVGDDIRNFIG